MKTGMDTRISRFVTVDIPPSHEGVGQALRAAFHADAPALPDDMMALLDQLNQK